MKQYFYPAIFHTAEEGGFWVSFPDLPECFTEGETMEEAYQMAIDALGLALSDSLSRKEPLPVPSVPSGIVMDGPGCYPVIVPFDLEAYQRKHNSRSVKKTLSIPEWLNEEATAMGINFSQTLQEALLAKLRSES